MSKSWARSNFGMPASTTNRIPSSTLPPYLAFLHHLAPHYRRRGAILIQDNASYHKDAEVWSWFKSNRHWLEVHQLPLYSPELNPNERLWQYTRENGTHDRYFASESELLVTLTHAFGDMQSYPDLIRPCLLPFC